MKTRPLRPPGRLPRLLALALLAAGGRPADGQTVTTARAYTAGNLVVLRVGDGSANLTTAATSVWLDQYQVSGSTATLLGSLMMLNTGAGDRLVLSGTAVSEGFIALSSDSRYIVLGGYDSAIGATTAANLTAVKTVGRVGASGAVDTSTHITDTTTGVAFRSVTSSDGFNIWSSEENNGVRYQTFGSTTAAQVVGGSSNVRVVDLYGGRLEESTSTAIRHVGPAGSLPTGTATVTGLTLSAAPSSAYGFVFAKLSDASAGPDTLYVADTNAIKKFVLSGTTWTAMGSITASSVTGLTGYMDGSNFVLYANLGGTSAAGSGSLYRFTDATGTGTVSGTATTLFSLPASSKKNLRDVVFAPAQLSWDASKAAGTWDTTSANFIQDGRGTPLAYHPAYTAYFGDTPTNVAVAVQSGGVTPANVIIQNRANTYTITGDIRGLTTVTKTGAGTARLDGNNTFGGGVVVGGGTLIGVARSSGTPFGNGVTTPNGYAITLNGGELRLDGIAADTTTNYGGATAASATDGSAVGVAGGATLTLNNAAAGQTTTLVFDNLSRIGTGTLVVNPYSGNLVASGPGEVLKVDADLVTYTVSAGPPVVTGTKPIIAPWAVQRQSNADPSGNFLVPSATASSNALVGGAGYATLDAADATKVADVPAAGITLAAPATAYALRAAGPVDLGTNTLTVGGVDGLAGVILNGSGTTVANGTLDLGAHEGTVYTAASATVSAVVAGTGASGNGLTAFGPGTLTLGNAANTFAGRVSLNQGVLAVAADGALGAASNALTFNGGTLRLTGSIGSSAAPSARAVAVNAAGGTFDVATGADSTLSGTLTGSGPLTKAGAGALTLSGVTAGFGGYVQVNAGTLALSGAATLKNAFGVTVAAGATFDVSGTTPAAYAVGNGQVFQGKGTVAVGDRTLAVGNGATLLAGVDSTGPSSVGKLTVAGTGATQLQGGGALQVLVRSLADDSTGSAAGTNYGQVNFGTLDVSALSSANKFKVVLKSIDAGGLPGAATAGEGTYLIGTYSSLTGTFDPATFQIDASGLTNYAADHTFTLAASSGALALTYAATAAPEPATALALGAAALGLLAGGRRGVRRFASQPVAAG